MVEPGTPVLAAARLASLATASTAAARLATGLATASTAAASLATASLATDAASRPTGAGSAAATNFTTLHPESSLATRTAASRTTNPSHTTMEAKHTAITTTSTNNARVS